MRRQRCHNANFQRGRWCRLFVNEGVSDEGFQRERASFIERRCDYLSGVFNAIFIDKADGATIRCHDRSLQRFRFYFACKFGHNGSMMMTAHVQIRSSRDRDFDYGFSWPDASTLILPLVGDSVTMGNVRARTVISRSFAYEVNEHKTYAAITLLVE